MSLQKEETHHLPTRKVRFSILLKLILIILTLISVTGLYTTWQNSELFRKISSEREENVNITMARAKSQEINNLIVSYVEKVKFFGLQIIRTNKNQIERNYGGSSVQTSFIHDADLLHLEIKIKDTNQNISTIDSIYSEKSLKDYKIPLSTFGQIKNESIFPIEKIFNGEILLEIRKEKDSEIPPLLILGLPLLKDEQGNVDHVGLSYIRIDRLQKSFGDTSERLLFLIDSNGNIMAHPDEELVHGKKEYLSSPIINDAINAQNIRIKQKRFEDPKTKEAFVGAFAKTVYGPIVISQSKESVILAPSEFVKRQGFFVLGILLSLSFYLVFSFSSSLTRPIKKLVSFSEKISQGEFDLTVSQSIPSHDEVGVLAVAFDNMIMGLRERDKIKNIFNKFHGVSVAEELLTNELNREGERKEVTVFFSDIRGFTSFSETHSPEEVVEMLNSYFEVMVKIINKYNGVVDKFIGDAIMAVWGIPAATGEDSRNAIYACLEMRQALVEYNKERIDQHKDPIWIGMGLHAGEVISGTVGSEDRMEYTIIGDTVNMASRIESCTKLFGTDLLVSEYLAKKEENQFILEAGGESKVKGKADAMILFKVNGIINNKGENVVIKTIYSHFENQKEEKVKMA